MTSRERYGGLDGLRGLAALSVFFCHVAAMMPPVWVPAGVTHSPLHVFWDGTAAVNLFFVLSGFVLALPFVGARRKDIPYAGFVIRRIFRIYPVYLVTVGLAILLRTELYQPIGMAGLSG
ncbi:MAG: acyltransferase family protein, partial [Polyangia bacterium]